MKTLKDDCFLHDKDRLKHEDAVDLLKSQLSCIAKTQSVNLKDAANSILAQDVTAKRPIPATDNSAVDGYAFAHAEYQAKDGILLVEDRIAAGDKRSISISPGSAVRIFTGAPMPDGSDSVAMQEDCDIIEKGDRQFVNIPRGLKPGANCRKAGEDVRQDGLVAQSGDVLRPQDIAAIASTGTPDVNVFSPLKVALISNGDEVIRPGAPFERGSVYDANHFMLNALLTNQRTIVVDLGICSDSSENAQSLLKHAAKNFDVIVSTGGASRGEEDHLISALETLGYCHMWQLAIKPGRPMGFGQVDKTPCFVLPGNPVAAFVCFLLYIRPALDVLGGASWREPKRYSIPSLFEISSKPDRREFLRGATVPQTDGSLGINKFKHDGSGLITGLREADGLIEIEETQTSVKIGEPVRFIPFSEFGIIS